MARRKQTSPASDESGVKAPAAPAPAQVEEDPELAQARAEVAATPCPGCEYAGTRLVFRVRKEGPNRGRLFAKCTTCERFDWLSDAPVPAGAAVPAASGDAERDALQASAPPCPKCGKPRRAQRVSKKGPNQGRLFLACSDRACDSFEWAETGPAIVPGAGPAASANTTEAGLLQAIREAPDDDAPRLIYADWLEDHSEAERAELIRVQCELARLPLGLRAAQLRQREKELLARHARAWAAPLARFASGHTFRRGLLEHVTISPDNFAQHADKLFRAAPLRSLAVEVAYGAPGLRKLTRCRHLLHVNELSLGGYGQCHRSGLKVLVESPNVANLTHLGLSHQSLSRPAIGDLAASPHLARLTHLDLSNNYLGRRWLLPLANSAYLANLTWLDVQGNICTPEDAAALATSPYLTRLTHLGLNPSGDLWADQLQQLFHSPNLARLTSLALDGLLPYQGPYVWSEMLGRLTTLTVSGGTIGDEGAAELAGTAGAANLTTLGLHYCNISPTGVEVLAASRHLANLTSLDLSANEIGDSGARALAQSPHLKRLVCLDLSRCELGPRGARALADSPNLPDYLLLNLAGNQLGKASRQALSRFSCLKVK
jgi:uncharacterized protein (TIGR02996 family)